MAVAPGVGEFTSGIKCSPEEIIQDGKNLVGKSVELMTEIGSFEGAINKLLEIWKGPSAFAIKEVFDLHKPQLKNFQETLESKGNGLIDAGNHLRSTEDENKHKVSTLGADKIGL